MKYYIFDLEGTLFFTDELNSECYNAVLPNFGLSKILEPRVTREIVQKYYPDISIKVMSKIADEKQKLFIKNIGRIIPNQDLLNFLQLQEKQNCLIWSASDKQKIDAIMKQFDLQNTIVAKKENIEIDVSKILRLLQCKLFDIVFFEDDEETIKVLGRLGASVNPEELNWA